MPETIGKREGFYSEKSKEMSALLPNEEFEPVHWPARTG
jgi:hypothetical protein